MNAALLGLVAFGLTMGAAMLGIAVSIFLPTHHRTKETRDIINVAIAVVATLAGLVAGLLTTAAKGSFDARENELQRGAGKIVQLDQVLAAYGPQTAEARALLRRSIKDVIDEVWGPHGVNLEASRNRTGVTSIERLLISISDTTEATKWLKYRALQLTSEIEELRWQMIQQRNGNIRWPFVAALVLWFTIIFFSFGLYAPRNSSVYVVFATSALCIATALYLIVHMDRPYSGLIQISSEPLTQALAAIDR